MKILTELQVYHSSFSFSSPLDSIQALSIISFPCFKCFSHAGVPLNHSPLAIQLFRSAEDISEDSCFLFLILSSYFEVVISFKLFNSTGAISISSNPSTMFLSSGP